MPWWSLAIVAALVCFALRPSRAFWAGFIGVFMLWLVAGLVADAPNEHILAGRMARVLPLGGVWWLFLIVSAAVGGLVAGFAGWTGAALADAFRLRRKDPGISRPVA
jgi:hypothetical protein